MEGNCLGLLRLGLLMFSSHCLAYMSKKKIQIEEDVTSSEWVESKWVKYYKGKSVDKTVIRLFSKILSLFA